MSSGNNTNSSNNGNSADKIDWQCVASPDLIEQVDDSLKSRLPSSTSSCVADVTH